MPRTAVNALRWPTVAFALALVHHFAPPSMAQTELSPLRYLMPTHGGGGFAVATGDVNGDGNEDIFVGGAQPGLLLGVGLGRFVNANDRLPTWTHFEDDIWALALGDVDADGDLDLLFGGEPFIPHFPTELHLYLNDGSGTFVEAVDQLPDINYLTRSISLFDLDLDGDLDAFVADRYGRNAYYKNDGAGFFSDASANLPADTCTTAAVGDVDGDGDPDILIGKRSFWFDELYLNNGFREFTVAPGRLPREHESESALELVDIDRDGDLDAILAGEDAQRLWLNDGAGTFIAKQDAFVGAPSDPLTISVADVDGDMDLDLLLSGALFLNDGAQTFTRASDDTFPYTGFPRVPSFLTDLDGDDDADAVLPLGLARSSVLLNSGVGTFKDVTGWLPDPPGISKHVQIGDVDGDGDADFFIDGGDLQAVHLHLNDGTGIFTPAVNQTPPDDSGTRTLGLGDLDNDGDLDLIIAKASHLLVLRNDGSGFFQTAGPQLQDAFQDPSDCALGDVDGDGDLDAFFVCPDTTAALALNIGGGLFVDGSAQIPQDTDEGHAVALGDVDGDGDLDAWLGNAGQDRLYVNDGTGHFADATAFTLPFESQDARDVELGDVDLDGDLDALVVQWGAPSRWLINDGTGRFADTALVWPLDAGEELVDADLGDLDLDGDLDVVLNRTWMYLNDGSGNFSSHVIGLQPTFCSRVALSDLDADGDLDCLLIRVGYGYQDLIFYNTTRQLTSRTAPGIGKPLQLDLHGPADSPWILFASRAEDHAPMGSLGLFRLDRSKVFLERVGILDAEVRGSFRLDVPDDPALIGITYSWQAIVGAPRRLTNLERTTLTVW